MRGIKTLAALYEQQTHNRGELPIFIAPMTPTDLDNLVFQVGGISFAGVAIIKTST